MISEAKKKVKFIGKDRKLFLPTIKLRVERYFQEQNLSKFATPLTHVKIGVLLTAGIIVYFSILFQVVNPLGMLFLCMILGVIKGFIAMNLPHDALHNSYSKYPFVNRMLGYIYDFMGFSSYIWKITHNSEHHTFTNIPGHDPDIDKPFLLRLSPGAERLWFHRYQNLYIWGLYSLVTINWIFISDYLFILRKWRQIPSKEIAIICGFKILNFIVFLVIPLLAIKLPIWQILFGFFTLHLFGGWIAAMVFQLAHLVENVDFPEPDHIGSIHNHWGVHEMNTTANFSTKSPVVGYIFGGLNYQIEHHLFPGVSHGHYPKISPIVRTTAYEFGLPYHENLTLWAAIRSHYRTIRSLGHGVHHSEVQLNK
jgi:linoleoyl-CoA desaturase